MKKNVQFFKMENFFFQQAQSQYYSLNTALKNAYIVAKSAPFAELMNFVDYSKLNCAVGKFCQNSLKS